MFLVMLTFSEKEPKPLFFTFTLLLGKSEQRGAAANSHLSPGNRKLSRHNLTLHKEKNLIKFYNSSFFHCVHTEVRKQFSTVCNKIYIRVLIFKVTESSKMLLNRLSDSLIELLSNSTDLANSKNREIPISGKFSFFLATFVGKLRTAAEDD